MCQESIFELTIHHLTPKWQLRSYCLCTRYIVQDHTGENLKESLLKILDEWSREASCYKWFKYQACMSVVRLDKTELLW